MRFILIDRLLEIKKGHRAVAEKVFLGDDPIFQSGRWAVPTVPASLLIECMAQTGGWLLLYTDDFKRHTFLLMIREAEFFSPVHPDETIHIAAQIESLGEHGGTVICSVRQGPKKTACGHLMFGTTTRGKEGETDRAGLRYLPLEVKSSALDWVSHRWEELGGPQAERTSTFHT